jgi:hypothetical protein
MMWGYFVDWQAEFHISQLENLCYTIARYGKAGILGRDMLRQKYR